MKTPEEIKKTLHLCQLEHILGLECTTCPYLQAVPCDDALHKDALALIQQLEGGIEEWEMVAASPGAVEDMARENEWLRKQLEQTAEYARKLEAQVPRWISAKTPPKDWQKKR